MKFKTKNTVSELINFIYRVSARLGEVALNSDCDDVAEQNYLNAIEEVFGDLKSSTPSAEYGANPPNSCAATPLDVPVEEVVVHPGYKYSLIDGFPNDLALVRLAESVQLSPFVHPICLRGLAKNLTPKEEAQGVLTVAGWGMTNMEGLHINTKFTYYLHFYVLKKK